MSTRSAVSTGPVSPRWPRLLSRQQAAEYLGVSSDTFERICPVQPVDLEMRGLRFDREKLDAWIDGLADRAEIVRLDEQPEAVGSSDQHAEARRQKSLERLKCPKNR